MSIPISKQGGCVEKKNLSWAVIKVFIGVTCEINYFRGLHEIIFKGTFDEKNMILNKNVE